MQKNRKNFGFTLIEMLIALGILSIVLMLASQGILTVLRMHRTQEALAYTQTKTRLVSEVLAQEIRGAILGGLSELPYPATGTSLSFALIDGGVGYPVTALSSNLVKIVAPSLVGSDLQAGDSIMVTNEDGAAFIATVNSVNGNISYTVGFNNCNTGVNFTSNSLLYKVKPIGYSYDPNTKILNYQIANQAQQPVAHDISDFKISYVYQQSDGTTVNQNNPIIVNGVPQKFGQIAGLDASLVRLRLDITAEGKDASNHTISRSYSSQIGLVDTTVGSGKNIDTNQFVQVNGIRVCN